MSAKAYSYIRFSTPEQAQGDSKRRQTDLAADWIQRNVGYELDTELTLFDRGISAAKGKNLEATAALGGFLREIVEGTVQRGSVLLVEALDRISRQTARKAVRTLEDIVESGVDVVTLNDGKRYTPASLDGTDFLMAILLFMRGAEESATKSKRNAASWAAKRATIGKSVMTSRVPAWVNVTGAANKAAGHNAKLSLNAERVKVLKRIFRDYNAGAGTAKIAYDLNQDKVPAFGGKFWVQKYVYKIIGWRAVLGEFTPCIGGKPQAPVPGYYPRAIDNETFETAQAIAESKHGRMPRNSGLIMNVLSKIGVCPKCGASMRRKQGGKKRSSPSQPKLVCSKADHGVGCDHVTVDLGQIERALRRWDCKIPRPDASLDDAIRSAEGSQEGLETEIEHLVDAIAARPSAALNKRLAEYETRLERVNADLERLLKQAGESDSRVLKRRAAHLKEALKTSPMDRAAVNVMLRTMLSKVVVEYPTAELVLHWKHDGVTRLDYSEELINKEIH